MSTVSNDYSSLFNSLTSYSTSASDSTTSSSNLLADYASIKNGSYAKLTKAYYGKTSTKKSVATDKEEAEETIKQNNLASAAGKSLRSAISKLSKDVSYDNVKAFVDAYNDVVDKGGESDNKSVLRNTLSMVKYTSKNSSLLEEVGISIGEDNKLSVDEETFKNASAGTLRSLFQGIGSYADATDAKAAQIIIKANYENSKLSGYNSSGTLNSDTVGSILDSSY